MTEAAAATAERDWRAAITTKKVSAEEIQICEKIKTFMQNHQNIQKNYKQRIVN